MTIPTDGILVVLDRHLKAPQPALKKGRLLAAALGCPLLVTVNSDSSAMRRAVGLDQKRRQAAEQQIRNAWERRIQDLLAGTEATVHITTHKDQDEDLRQTVIAAKPRLVVVHTSEEGTLRRHLFTPRDWLLIRRAPCPVLCVQDRPWSEPPVFTAAIEPEEEDESGLDTTVLAAAREWSASLQASLNAVHVLEHPDETLLLVAGEALPEYAASAESIRKSHREALDRFAERHGLPLERTEMLEGPIAGTLADYCENNGTDVLVVGTVRRNKVERLLLGATAESLLVHARNDVLVIKPDGFDADWQ